MKESFWNDKSLIVPAGVGEVVVNLPVFDDSLEEGTESLVLNVEDKVLSADIYDNDYSDSDINISPY